MSLSILSAWLSVCISFCLVTDHFFCQSVAQMSLRQNGNFRSEDRFWCPQCRRRCLRPHGHRPRHASGHCGIRGPRYRLDGQLWHGQAGAIPQLEKGTILQPTQTAKILISVLAVTYEVRGSAQHSGSACASHPAGLGLNHGIYKFDVAELIDRSVLLRVRVDSSKS